MYSIHMGSSVKNVEHIFVSVSQKLLKRGMTNYLTQLPHRILQINVMRPIYDYWIALGNGNAEIESAVSILNHSCRTFHLVRGLLCTFKPYAPILSLQPSRLIPAYFDLMPHACNFPPPKQISTASTSMFSSDELLETLYE